MTALFRRPTPEEQRAAARAAAKFDAQVAAAVALLAPKRNSVAKVRDEVESSITEIDRRCADAAKPLSKAARATLRRMIAALRRAEAAGTAMSHLDIGWYFSPLDLSEHIARCERQLNEPRAPRGHRPPLRQQLAVAHAYGLVASFGKPEDYAVSRGNKWHKLAAILYDDPRRDLFRHMRALKTPARPFQGSK